MTEFNKEDRNQEQTVNQEMKKDQKQTESFEREIDLVNHLVDITDFDEALTTLKREGEKHGITFKRGKTYYNSDKSIKYKSIVCSYGDLHFKEKESRSDSLPTDSRDKPCKVFYRFEREGEEEYSLVTFNQNHTDHKLVVKKDELSPDMINEIKDFNKRSKVNEVKQFLQTKFKVQLSYKAVYNEFRKLFPFFDSQDATIFLDFCSKNGYKCIKNINEENQTYSKLFITSGLMIKYYEEFGDILIVDATYKVNKYSLPLVIFSGFTHTGKNCIFGVGIINDETEKTYSWIFKQFFNILTTPPKFIVTGQDLSIQTVISKEYATSIKYHLNCPWHVQQNFKKNFSYLATIKLSEIKDKIILLPFIKKKEEFESNVEEIMKTLKQRKLEKSMAYLNNQLLSKEKWAKAYLPMEFTGGVPTNSRAESINSLIKRYVDSRSEMIDFLRFLIDYELKSCSNKPEPVLDTRNQ